MTRSSKPTRVDLRHIRSFQAVAEHGGFRIAADALGLSQPTLSAHIAELEEELGVVLLSRTTRHVRLTRMGETFLARTRRALDDLQLAANELRGEAALERGRITIACTPSLVVHVVAAALRVFREKHPGVSVQVFDIDSDAVMQCVAKGKSDIGVCPRPERAPNLVCQPLGRDRFVAVVPTGLFPGTKSAVNLADLAALPMIVMHPSTSMRVTFDRACASAGLDCKPAFEVHHHSTMLALVEAGLGIALMPESVVDNSVGRYARIVNISNPEIGRDVGIVHRRGEVLAPAAAEFAKLLRQAFAKLGAR
jgi:LysR family carnitine catabolism transcriptional activator